MTIFIVLLLCIIIAITFAIFGQGHVMHDDFKMATGFECEFAEKVSKGIQAECPICLLVLREPYQATCCGKSFCKKCIHRIKAANQACPTCNDKDFTLFPNKGLQQSLYDFQVYCTHKSKGCEWTGELRELDNHLNSDPPADKALQGCLYTLIKCPLSCAGCERGVCRKDIKSHVNDKLLGHVMMQTAQIKSLEEKLQGQLKKDKRDKQHFEKRMTELEAKVHELGVNNANLDVKNRELENEIKALKVRQANVIPEGPYGKPILKQQQQPVAYVSGTYKPSGGEFTMTNFDEYKRDNDIWYSPHFYTYPNGYKMCLQVHPHGDGPDKGTHLSVYVCLMRGEYDDHLKWPFLGNITIKLVNQEEDKDHMTKIVHFTRSVPEKVSGRVMIKERASAGQGYGRFLPYAELEPKYLKDDCIKLCVKKVELFYLILTSMIIFEILYEFMHTTISDLYKSSFN